MSNPKLVDLTGAKFGAVTVLREDGRIPYRHKSCVAWLVYCDTCKQTKHMVSDNLRYGKPRMNCGCDKTSYKKSADGLSIWRHHMAVYSKKAGYRHHLFNLGFDAFTSLCLGNCYYCNSAPKRRIPGYNRYVGSDIVLVNGVDRVDNAGDYEVGNCVPCCWECNNKKGGMKMTTARRIIAEGTNPRIDMARKIIAFIDNNAPNISSVL